MSPFKRLENGAPKYPKSRLAAITASWVLAIAASLILVLGLVTSVLQFVDRLHNERQAKEDRVRIESILKNVERIVEDIEQRQSPEAQAERDRIVSDAIQRITDQINHHTEQAIAERTEDLRRELRRHQELLRQLANRVSTPGPRGPAGPPGPPGPPGITVNVAEDQIKRVVCELIPQVCQNVN